MRRCPAEFPNKCLPALKHIAWRLEVLILRAQACREGYGTNQKSNNPCKWAKSSIRVKELSKCPQEADPGPFFVGLDDCYILQKTKHNLQGERKEREWHTRQKWPHIRSNVLSLLKSLRSRFFKNDKQVWSSTWNIMRAQNSKTPPPHFWSLKIKLLALVYNCWPVSPPQCFVQRLAQTSVRPRRTSISTKAVRFQERLISNASAKRMTCIHREP